MIAHTACVGVSIVQRRKMARLCGRTRVIRQPDGTVMSSRAMPKSNWRSACTATTRVTIGGGGGLVGGFEGGLEGGFDGGPDGGFDGGELGGAGVGGGAGWCVGGAGVG